MEYVPLAQFAQLEEITEPVTLPKVPATQLLQLDEPEVAWYLPTMQFTQLVDNVAPEVASDVPATHDTHPADVPMLGWNVPAKQIVQAEDPAIA